ncbi:hypothetical protein ATK17_1618 [Branchiibius hedensis]|uniref:Uncharacterized protein n=1 Tax=Branchiibius hedensis TaxID=672460 RepID=A0A2Y8ZR06_9MICO|nr:hypothetical protein [Branchiibius hedensis]PWJ25491.1 hypothetical protein ATK17_1618 [Branchiibius hedensis]SSA34304.1 hypothetical protein SAMN04489750_1618 [Branchiibius hedensis]
MRDTPAQIAARPAPCCPPGCISTDHDEERASGSDSWYFHRAITGQGSNQSGDEWLVEVQICEPFDDNELPDPATVFIQIPGAETLHPGVAAAIGETITSASALAREWSGLWLGVPPVAPEDVVCPDWCRYNGAWHFEQLNEFDGHCIHLGEVAGAHLALTTWPDGSPTQDAPTVTLDDSLQQVTAGEAVATAAALLAGVAALNDMGGSPDEHICRVPPIPVR